MLDGDKGGMEMSDETENRERIAKVKEVIEKLRELKAVVEEIQKLKAETEKGCFYTSLKMLWRLEDMQNSRRDRMCNERFFLQELADLLEKYSASIRAESEWIGKEERLYILVSGWPVGQRSFELELEGDLDAQKLQDLAEEQE